MTLYVIDYHLGTELGTQGLPDLDSNFLPKFP